MLDKYIFNEDIKRVFSFMKKSQIIKNYILKDYISDIKIINYLTLLKRETKIELY